MGRRWGSLIREVFKPDIVLQNEDTDLLVVIQTSSPNQPIKCLTHNSFSCVDVIRVLTDNLDADHLWIQGLPDEDLMIPIMPSESIFVNVLVQPIDNTSTTWRVLVNDPRSVDEAFVGFLNPGEGRGVIRQMMINWFEVEFVSIHKCKFQSHGSAAEEVWRRNSKNSRMNFLDRYSVWSKGMCKFCSDKNVLEGDDDDLIPTDESNTESAWTRQRKLQRELDERRARSEGGKNPNYPAITPTGALKKPRPGKPMMPPIKKGS